MSYYVFLDFDGVFTSTRQHYAFNAEYEMWAKFDPVAVDFMNRIHDKYEDVKFVLTTTWKNNVSSDMFVEHIIQSMMANAGFRGVIDDEWKTNFENDTELENQDRAYQVKKYLDGKTDVDDFIIFDDTNYQFDKILKTRRWIRTDPDNGLLWKHMKNASSLMGKWNEK